MLVDEQARANPFFAHGPARRAGRTPSSALAAMATVIASQALISGAFSLTHQAVQLGFFPRVTITHTSQRGRGADLRPRDQLGPRHRVHRAGARRSSESSRLAAAYGIAVTGTMGITSIVFFVVTRTTWSWPLWKGAAAARPLPVVRHPVLRRQPLKFLDGGYVPILVGAAFFTVMGHVEVRAARLRRVRRFRRPSTRRVHRERRPAVQCAHPGGRRLHVGDPATASRPS